jgi:hypothetical protein
LRELDVERGADRRPPSAAANAELLQSPSLGSGAAHGLALNGPSAAANVYDDVRGAAAAPAPSPSPSAAPLRSGPLPQGGAAPAPPPAAANPYDSVAEAAHLLREQRPAPSPAANGHDVLPGAAAAPAPSPAAAHGSGVLPGAAAAPAPLPAAANPYDSFAEAAHLLREQRPAPSPAAHGSGVLPGAAAAPAPSPSPAAAPRRSGPLPQVGAAPPASQPLPQLAQPQAAAAPRPQPQPRHGNPPAALPAAPPVDPQLKAARAERRRALAPSPERLERRAAWHAQLARGKDKSLITKPLHEQYKREEINKDTAKIGRKLENGLAGVGTRYADSPADFGMSLEGGALKQGGQNLDSTGSKRMWRKDKGERVNYAMDGTGGLHAADARAEFDRSVDPASKSAVRHNHSSLVGGAEVAAAGTMKVRDGKVEELADDSGHYKPSLPHTHQAFEKLVGGGAMDPMRSTVRLEGKRQFYRGKVDEKHQPVAETEPELNISGNELDSYGKELRQSREDYAKGGAAAQLQSVEHKIRAAHAPKERALGHLKAATRKNVHGEVIDAIQFGDFTFRGGAPRASELREDGLYNPEVHQHWAKMREMQGFEVRKGRWPLVEASADLSGGGEEPS